MTTLIGRAIVTALAAAATGLMLTAGATALDPAILFDMERPLPSSATGFYGIERVGDEWFAWTSERAVLRFSGLDRGASWACGVRFRGTRPPDVVQPILEVAVDNITVAARTATNDYQDLELTIPRRSRAGGTLAFTSTPTFVPGDGDPRVLGVQVDRIECRPRRGWAWPSTRGAVGSAAGAAAFAGAVILAGGSIALALGLAGALAAGQAAVLTSGGAQVGAYAETLPVVAVTIAGILLLVARGLAALLRRPLQPAALCVVGVSALAVVLKLLGLLHPSKTVVDALFQAHRLEAVLDGQYYFTQPMPDGVSFPYAIGLYVFAAPWTILTSDLVSLLRVVVVASEAIAGGILYLLIVRAWRLPAAGVWAVVLFHLVPLPYVVVGNGNLTNAFGQSAALVTMAAAMLWLPRPGQLARLLALTLLATLAFCSHISTLALLGAGLAALAAWLAMAGGMARRRAAAGVIAAAVLALGLSVVAYYGHFSDVFLQAATRVTDVDAGRSELAGTPGLLSRAWVAVRETIDKLGWPAIALAAVGAWHLARARPRDELTAGVLAWASVWIVFVLVTVATRVDLEYERYAVEFLGRVNLATYPAVVLLAARAASAPWSPDAAGRTPLVKRGAVLALVSAAAWVGVTTWLAWFR